MEIAGKRHLSWEDAYGRIYADESQEEKAPWMAKLKQKTEYVPAEIENFLEEDIDELLALSRGIFALERPEDEAQGVLPYYSFYRKIVEKMVALAMERHGEKFESTDTALQRKVLGWKLEMPGAEELYDQSLAYTMGRVKSPYIFPGQNFEDIVTRLVQKPDLKAKIVRAYNQYVLFFLNKKAA